MGLMDAQEYDPRPAERRRMLIIIAAIVIVVPLLVWRFFFYYWPEERVVNRFFDALQRKDFDAAYGIYNADPNWQQHPEKYATYPLSMFKLDWGPSGDYGAIVSHRIDCAKEPPKTSGGVIVNVIVNNRAQATSFWVDKRSKGITIPPPVLFELQCHPPR